MYTHIYIIYIYSLCKYVPGEPREYISCECGIICTLLFPSLSKKNYKKTKIYSGNLNLGIDFY